eukprot:2097401-Rhodomonas_salina.1
MEERGLSFGEGESNKPSHDPHHRCQGLSLASSSTSSGPGTGICECMQRKRVQVGGTVFELID